MRRLRVIGWCQAVVLFAMCARSTYASASESEPSGTGPAGSSNHISELAYLNPEVGVEYVGLQTLHLTRELFPSRVNTSDIGPAVGVGAGVRLLFLTLGARFRFGHFRQWDLWTLNAEVGFKAPLGAIEPFIGLGAGYAKLGSLQDREVLVQGYDIRLTAGVDYYFNKTFSIGGAATADLLGMTRAGVDLNQRTGSLSEEVYKLDGSSVGIAIMASAVVGVHL
jgi:hypothetical protein